MKKTKIQSLVATAYIDGFFDSRELYIINQKAKDLGLDGEEILEIIRNPEKQEFVFPVTEEEKLEFMYDLMVVIYADAIIDELEIKIFYKYLNKLEFKKQIQDHLFEIIKDSVKNNKEFKEFLSKNFGDG
jgi:uncharacterized membrane protein YebE (DUF533 family)